MLDDLKPDFLGLALAIALGFLVGLQREWTRQLVGLRTFTLIGATGGLAALLAQTWGAWIIAAGLVAVAAMIGARYLRHHVEDGEPEPGSTTLVAALAVYLVGAACVAGYQTHAVTTAGVITLLLHWKQPLHGWVERIGEEEFNAIVRFVLIALVVLPILPNDTFGPYEVLNPFEAWLLVVLIVGLNLVGYVAFRLFSADGGAVVAGILGGAVSSTATTVSFAGLAKRTPELAAGAALIILLASTVVYVRVGIELALVGPGLLPHAIAPMSAFAAVLLAASLLIWPRVRRQPVEMPEQRNPARLEMALSFAALYLIIIFAVAASRQHLGDDAVYAVAFVSGLTDVDAMTLSLAQLHSRGDLPAEIAWRAIFLATLSNLAFKIGAACVLGPGALRSYMLTLGAASLAAGGVLLAVWP